MPMRRIALPLLLLFLAACASAGEKTPALPPTGTASQPTPRVHVTTAPDASGPAQAFLQAWQAEDYEKMYAMLDPASQAAIPQDRFIQRYKDAATTATLQKLDIQILSNSPGTTSAETAYRVTFHTALLGDITRDTSMKLVWTGSEWRIAWDDGMILPELHGGNRLALDARSPARGNIYDRNGEPLAVTSEAVSLAVNPADLVNGDEGAVLKELSRLTGKPAEWIKSLYGDNYSSNYLPAGETTQAQWDARAGVLSSLSGLIWRPYTSRYYPAQGIAPHVVGYAGPIFKEDLESYQRKGYNLGDRVGKTGLELWGERPLAGKKTVDLYVTGPQGEKISKLASSVGQPAENIYTTLDANLQEEAQKAISGFTGAVVVVERDTGRVLAMASSPGFDPNYLQPENLNSTYGAGEISSTHGTLVNRAANGGGYPLGSVFKIVTMATALETGIFTPQSTYDCQSYFTEEGFHLKDWTVDHDLPPSGILTLPQGLMRSCDPWFYKIGLDLFNSGQAGELTKMANAFGLGVDTGIQQIDETPGNMPDPQNKDAAVRMAIGQDQMLVQPLQVASMLAAVGNGGTLYRPQLVEKITAPDGTVTYSFKAEERGTLPVKPENLKVIQDALHQVTVNPRGTAVNTFSSLGIYVAGKTGTAESDLAKPHAWFAAYTNEQRADKPDIAVAVIAEYTGEGADYAAPITRRVIEVYFLGRPVRRYPWEAKLYVTRTPTPTDTPTPAP